MMTTSDYIAIGTLACGLVGTLVAVTAAWAKDLDAAAQRVRILDEATKRALFWDTWSKAMANADPEANAAGLRAKIKIEITAAAQSVEAVYSKPPTQRPTARVTVSQYKDHRSSLSRIRRWFLLYNPPRWRAWIPRFFFYIYVLEAPVFPFVISDAEFRGYANRFGMSLGFVFLALVFRWVSIWAERPRTLGQSS